MAVVGNNWSLHARKADSAYTHSVEGNVVFRSNLALDTAISTHGLLDGSFNKISPPAFSLAAPSSAFSVDRGAIRDESDIPAYKVALLPGLLAIPKFLKIPSSGNNCSSIFLT